jgi:hypothetical protein
MPAAANAAITAISLLTVPAADDREVQAAISASPSAQQVVPSYLWQHAYSLYGYGKYATSGQVGTITAPVVWLGLN